MKVDVYVHSYRQFRSEFELHRDILAHESEHADLLADMLAEDGNDFGLDKGEGN